MSWTLEVTDPHGAAWKGLLAATPHLLFHEPVWADLLQAGVSSHVVCLLFRHRGAAKAGALGFLLGTLGIRIAYFSYPYGSLIGSPPPAHDLQRLLRDFAAQRGVCQMQFVGYPGAPPLPNGGFRKQCDTTHVLSLEGMTPETLWRSYRRSRRQDIRKTRDRGIVVAESTSNHDIEAVYDFYLQTMRRTSGIARYKKALIEAVLGTLAPRGRARLLVAQHDGRPIAGMLVVDSPHLSHGLLLVSSTAARTLQPNKLLLHTAAERSCASGKSGLDFMPSGQSAPGVADFKKLWHAREIPLVHYTLPVTPVRAWLWRRAYQLASRQPFRGLLSIVRRRW